MRIQTLSQWLDLLAGSVMMGLFFTLSAFLMPHASGLLGMIMLIRLCWIEDNIVSDLLYAEQLKKSYTQPQIWRAKMSLLLFGRHDPFVEDPKHMACLLRRQSWALQAATLALLAGALTHVGGVFWMLIAAALCWRGMERLEWKSATQDVIQNQTLLPFHIVVARPKWLPFLTGVAHPKKPDHWPE